MANDVKFVKITTTSNLGTMHTLDTVDNKSYFHGGSRFDSLAEIEEYFKDLKDAGAIESFSVTELTESEYNRLTGYIE